MLENQTTTPAHIAPRLLPESGVIVVEIKQALGPADFALLASTADEWVKTRGPLNGLVLHAHHFPGWESLRGVMSHIRFVRDHHREVRRIALVTDSRLAGLVPQLAEHFVKAEVKAFAFDELDAATVWAGARRMPDA
ncbi:MAG TPA: STAS/SEC14 domain-containing protein [Polyangiaceae bacterium]|nr:STAS/SEC14 domain-containing protein [Polyangiaceae bacterium]